MSDKIDRQMDRWINRQIDRQIIKIEKKFGNQENQKNNK